MPITKTVKAKDATKTKPVLTPAKSEITLQAEEFIMLHAKLLEMGAFELMKNYEKIKKVLQEHAIAAGTDAKEQYTFTTDKGDVVFKAAQQTKVVTDKEAMIKALGPKLFKDLAKVGMTDLTKYLGEIELAQFTETVNGSRALASVTPK